MPRVKHKRVPLPTIEEQKKIYMHWAEVSLTLQKLADHYNIGKATIQRIITKGLSDKWHN